MPTNGAESPLYARQIILSTDYTKKNRRRNMVVLDLFDGDVTFLLERSVQTVVECNTNVILKSQFVLGENFWFCLVNSLTYTKLMSLSTSLHFFAFGFNPHKRIRPRQAVLPRRSKSEEIFSWIIIFWFAPKIQYPQTEVVLFSVEKNQSRRAVASAMMSE